MTDKPNYSLKDLLNELKDKEKELELLNKRLHKAYLLNRTQEYTKLLLKSVRLEGEISAYKKGISACEEILSQQNKIIGSGALEVPQVVSTLKSENKICPSADNQTNNLNNTSTNLNLNKGCGIKQGVYRCGDIIGKNNDCIILCDKCSEDNNGR